MATKKWDNATKIVCALLTFAGIIVGTLGTKIFWPDKPTSIPPDHSLVQQFQGVYIYLRSRPENTNFISLGTVGTNSLTRAIENANGKKGLGDILGSIGKSVVNDLDFDTRLSEIVDGAKKYNPDVQGVIFIKDLTQCQLIKFN